MDAAPISEEIIDPRKPAEPQPEDRPVVHFPYAPATRQELWRKLRKYGATAKRIGAAVQQHSVVFVVRDVDDLDRVAASRRTQAFKLSVTGTVPHVVSPQVAGGTYWLIGTDGEIVTLKLRPVQEASSDDD